MKITNKNSHNGLGVRIYKNEAIEKKDSQGKVVQDDTKDLLAIINKTFSEGTPTTQNLEKFNQLLIETVYEISQPAVDEILGYLAEYSKVPAGTVKYYQTKKTAQPKWVYTAKGAGVDFQRIAPEATRILALPQEITFSGYYELTSFIPGADVISNFKDTVTGLAKARVELYFEKINKLVDVAITNGKIPANNRASATTIGVTEFNKVQNTMVRLSGGRPLLIADTLLIDQIAGAYTTNYVTNDLLTNEVRDMLREDLVPTKISKSIAIPFANDFINEDNSKVRFDVKRGYVIPGGAEGKKAFGITEFGVDRVYHRIDPETEQVEVIIKADMDITLINGRYLGCVTSTSLTLG